MKDKNKTYRNAKTTVRSFRITHTQNALLEREQKVDNRRASAIIRVLLSSYFNKRILDIEHLIAQEMCEAQERELRGIAQ
jgi:hypothetical protein